MVKISPINYNTTTKIMQRTRNERKAQHHEGTISYLHRSHGECMNAQSGCGEIDTTFLEKPRKNVNSRTNSHSLGEIIFYNYLHIMEAIDIFGKMVIEARDLAITVNIRMVEGKMS
jgi:hypothetical protein